MGSQFYLWNYSLNVGHIIPQNRKKVNILLRAPAWKRFSSDKGESNTTAGDKLFCVFYMKLTNFNQDV